MKHEPYTIEHANAFPYPLMANGVTYHTKARYLSEIDRRAAAKAEVEVEVKSRPQAKK